MPFGNHRCASGYVDDSLREGRGKRIRSSVADDVVTRNIGDRAIILKLGIQR